MSVMATDFIKRFTPTLIEITFELSGTSIRLETNCSAAADRLRRALKPSSANGPDAADFVLRIVAESEDDLEFEAVPTVHRLSDDGLSFISLGYTSFIACDRRARQAISFISRSLVTDERRFTQHFLPALISQLKECIEKPL
jgi:hypothetical protein